MSDYGPAVLQGVATAKQASASTEHNKQFRSAQESFHQMKQQCNSTLLPSSFIKGFSFGLLSHVCLSRLSVFRALYSTRVYLQNAWTRAMSMSLISGFSFSYVSLWLKQVDEDIRTAGPSDEFAQSIYEYKVRDDSRKVGVDLLKFYELRLDQKNSSQAERN